MIDDLNIGKILPTIDTSIVTALFSDDQIIDSQITKWLAWGPTMRSAAISGASSHCRSSQTIL